MNTAAEIKLMGVTDKKSVKSIVSSFGKQLSSYVKSRIRVIEDAEDIVQEIWYQLAKMTNIEDIDNLSAWLYSVANNKITDKYRKKKSDSLDDLFHEDNEGNLRIRQILFSDTGNSPDLEFVKEIFWEQLFISLDELPENQRYVFIQNELEGRTLQDIADETEENLKTIISRKSYAVKYLRKKLQSVYDEFINQ